jgi:multidrug efflux pump subunit AcrA (membrane-fusion protein)
LLTACSSNASQEPTPTPLPPLVNYEKAIFTVERGPIVAKKDLMGDIVPSKQDELFFRASGFVTRVTVKAGDQVKKGDLLAEMQIDDLMNQLQQARIDYEVAQANQAKDKAQREFDLNKAKGDVIILQKRVDLAKIDLQQAYGIEKEKAQLNLDIAQENLTLAEGALNVLTADTNPYMEQAVKRSQLSVERLEKLVSERQVLAPYDCQILRSTVKAGQQIETFNSVFVVGDPANLVVRSPYTPDLEGKLNEQSEVSLKIGKDSETQYKTQNLPGFLVSSSTDQAAKTSVTTSLNDYLYFSLPTDLPKDQVRIGRQVFMTVILGKKDDVLLLPPAAIREYKGLNFVIVQNGDRRRRVEINQIGLKSTDQWEVIGDLREGDQVLGP